MSRILSALTIVLILVSFTQPAPAFTPILDNPTPASPLPGYQLNSEGDEWVWVDPQHVAPLPPSPPEWRQGEEQELLPAALPTADLPQPADETFLGAALDAARQAGPQAVLEFVAAQPDSSLPLLQAAVLDAQLELAPPQLAQPAAPAIPRVSINSSPCAYDTIQAALTAAVNGDTIRISTGVYTESIDISGKVITLQGGYDASCASVVGGLTELRASAAGSVVDLSSGAIVSMTGLGITGGTSFGAGIDVLGASRAILNSTDVYNNNGASGGGLYIGATSMVTYTNDSDIYNNTASAGGGAIVYGRLFGFDSSSDIYSNSSTSSGGGLYVSNTGRVILDNADVVANTAAQSGGGIFVSSAAITLTNSVFVGETAPCCQTAANGGGIYAINSRVSVKDAATSVINNTASGSGGGIYLTNASTLDFAGGSLGSDSSLNAGNDAALGAGLYTISSTVVYTGRIINNIASNSGAGIYADQSTLNITNATIGGVGVNQHNRIGASGLNGAGLYLINNSRAAIDHTDFISNTLSNPSTGYGGGLYVRAGSTVTMTNSSVQQHHLPSAFDGRGAGMYIYDATVTLSNTQVLSNTTQTLGGGARLFGVSRLDILGGSVFRDNQALGGVGGAIAATNSADINANHATFQSNTASSHGGAIYLDAGNLDFTGAWDVRFNQAGGNGGAIACTGAGDVDLIVTSGLFPTYLSGNQANGSGGAVYVSNTDNIQLYGVSGFPLTVSANTAGAQGGALYANSAAFFDVYGDIRLTGNTSSGNGGMAFLGGGARIWLDDYVNSFPQVLDNTAANGGAIYASNSPRVECDGAIFGLSGDGNTAASGSGGALYLSGSTLTADNCTFSNNQAQAGNGGGIAAITSTVRIDVDYPFSMQASSNISGPASPRAPNATACDPRVRQCSSLYENTASGDGGALYSNASSLTVNSSYLHRNSAQRGGALYQAGASATGIISNTLVYSNTSTLAFGAGIRAAGGTMTIRHATLANNTGGAGYSPGSVQSYIYNTIIWGNSVAAFGSLTDAQCNIDQGGTAGPATDPQFFFPGGGENYRLQYSSPAIDACASGLPIDLMNISRPQISQFDMGAFEMPEPAYVEIAHLSPFASDPGTAVTITQDGLPLLIDFSFADSTGYLEIPSGESLFEAWLAGASAPAITATLNLTPTNNYSLVAAGDGSRQPLEMVALLDNFSMPAPGKFHLRVLHLMPFAAGSLLVDLRLQDGAPVLTDVAYGDVNTLLSLDAGVYDLKITTPGGAITLVDPLPVSFAEGQVVNVIAVGDGTNQPLGVFAWNAGEPGALLPLAAYGVSLSPPSAAQQGAPGETVIYTLHITNTGDTSVDFALTSTSTWSVALPNSIVIAPGGSAQFEAQVTIPASASDGDSDVAAITAAAKSYPSASAQSTLTTTAARRAVYLPIVINQQ